jgi:uncharacterized membrane protein (DUF106 family)
MNENDNIPSIFSQADAKLAKQKAEEIERLKRETQQARLSQKRAKERKKQAELKSKLIAPIILIITLIISYLIWQQ